MKRYYSIILFVFIYQCSITGQNGTIKIAKPAKKDTIVPKRYLLGLTFDAALNYTFKSNKKVGYDFTVSYIPGRNKNSLFGKIGLQYSIENQYYQLSPYNSSTFHTETGYSKSQNRSDFLKLPIDINYWMPYGARGGMHLSAGLTPEYLLKTKDEHQRLVYRDFNQYNLAAKVEFGMSIRRRFSFSVRYSKDLFENLKDRNIYNDIGQVTEKQGSKTNLISFSIRYIVHGFTF